MNDGSIPFIRQYDEWAILDAARRSAAGWRKQRYKKRTMVVPENKRYLAANSAKRNPNAPRGARFPAHSSKRDRTLTPDDDDSGLDDERVPVLPPGPSISSNPVGFPSGGSWNTGPSLNYPTHPVPGPSQLPFGDFGPFLRTQAATTPSINPWGPINPQSFPSSGTSTNSNYWENPPPGTLVGVTPLIPLADI